MRNKWVMVSVVLAGSLLLGGCETTAVTGGGQTVEEARPTQTLTGTVVLKEGVASLMMADKQIVEMESRKIDFKTYDGKTVSVTGEYSGTTLFVDEIK